MQLKMCFMPFVILQPFRICPENDGLGNYDIWGAVVTEVEVDILTGEMFVVRADIIEDAGLSVSPQV